jgi:hypothetical protein
VFHFTLSGLLFQINLKHLLSISFLYFSGTTQALATYVNIGTIKDLIIKISPKIVKFLFVHKVINYSFFLFYFPNLIFHILLYHVQNISLELRELVLLHTLLMSLYTDLYYILIYIEKLTSERLLPYSKY